MNDHPDCELRRLYKKQGVGYQGADPLHAEFLFVGEDANFPKDIVQNAEVFPKIVEYLKDGAGFWRKYDLHHPLLLLNQKGSGKGFHQKFKEIGFNQSHAGKVSFLEIYHGPTIGGDRKTKNYIHAKALDQDPVQMDHIKKLNHIIVEGAAKYIFVSEQGLIYMWKHRNVFTWLNGKKISDLTKRRPDKRIKFIHQWKDKAIIYHYNFSAGSRNNKSAVYVDQNIREIGKLCLGSQ
ncbi:MAG: hypothetical protein HQL89_01680 [Magnetococcales bacterium]|nr:hypothetical protein [Magnetococcales bacterium]